MNQIGLHRKGKDQEDDQNVHREWKKLVLDDRQRASSDMRHGDFPAPTVGNRSTLLQSICSSGGFDPRHASHRQPVTFMPRAAHINLVQRT